MGSAKETVKRWLGRYFINDLKDTYALEQLAPLADTYTPWTSSALRPSALTKVLNDVVVNDRRSVVECGGGISTMYLARLFRTLGRGQVLTLEHDARWADKLQALLGEEELGSYVEVVHAPLAATQAALDDQQWYDPSTVRDAIEGRTFDLLLVDGPPAHSPEIRGARYPAVPVLREWMEEQCTILLDDINREGEREVVARWEDLLGIEFHHDYFGGTIARGVRGPSYNV